MKKCFKRAISYLLAVILCICIVPMGNNGMAANAKSNRVLLIQGKEPWNSTANEMVLRKIGIEYKKISASQFLNEDLTNYTTIILANDQTTSTYNDVIKFRSQMEQFAYEGGVILFGACDEGWGDGSLGGQLPGGIIKKHNYQYNNYVVDNSHPIITGELTDNKVLTDEQLIGNYCSHASFDSSTFVKNTKVIIKDGNGDPTLIQYPLGKGFIIASGLTWEFYYERTYGGKSFSSTAMEDMFRYLFKMSGESLYFRGVLEKYTVNVILNSNENSWVSEVIIDGKEYKVKRDLLTDETAKQMQNKMVIGSIENGEIVEIKLLNDLKVNVKPALSLSDIEYTDGKYKKSSSSCNVWIENRFSGSKSMLNYISNDPTYIAEVESITLTSTNDKLKFKDSDKFLSWSNKSITIKPENVRVEPGSFISAGYFTLDMSNSHKLTGKNEEITVNCKVKYKLNGQTLESSTDGKVKLINNDYVEPIGADANDAVTELNKITNAATMNTSFFLNEQMTVEQRNAVRDALLTMVALSASDKKAFEKELDTKIVDKLFSMNTNILGVKNGSVSIVVEVKTKDYGNLKIRFTCDYRSYALNSNPYAFNGDISYEIIGGWKSNKVPEKSGSCGALYGADVKAFSDAATDVALSEIKNAYNKTWGKDLNNAADIIFGKTMNKILKQTKYKSVSGLVWKLIITPATEVKIKCPVDVYVYNSDDKLVAYVENDVAVSNDENVIAIAEDHEKTFTLFDDTYSLEYVPTCEGTMTVEVSEYGTSVDLLSTKAVADIPLSIGVNYTQSIDTNVLSENDYTLVSLYGGTFELEEIYDGFHVHEVRSDWKDIPATCTENGYRYALCSICNDWFKEDTNVATGHTDKNNDGKCDTCEETMDSVKNCSHNCHKGGFMGFIWKIINFFNKLFRSNQYCSCGVKHW